LSFSTFEGKEIVKDNKDFGDIFICLPRIKKQAKEYKIIIQEEFIRMLVHGILHLLGYDHIKKNQIIQMLSVQEKFVKKLL